ncbi:MAG: SusF/SusE family outer membrane protein [Bacteroidota bacterium]|nr:MAG: SusF/SusE family outer membrane protein [Bacteroidota bacterium]
MKIKNLNILFSLLAVMFFVTSCQDEETTAKLPDQNDTWGVRNITSTSAELSGIVVAGSFVEYGVCYDTAANPTIEHGTASIEDPEGAVYWVTATNLEHLTKYYARAYVINSSGAVTYGADTSFTTLANVATVTINEITAIRDTSATSGGDVPYDGKSTVTAKGLCWSMSANPTVDAEEGVFVSVNGDSIGAFTHSLRGLVGGTTYYVRAYATNRIGTAYSEELSFTTLVGLPVVSTDSVTAITKVSANVYGNVPYTGGADVTERGFYWGTSADPDAGDNVITDAADGTGTISASLTGLEAGVTYFIRAYAINSTGTAYGNTIEFTTVANIIIWYLPGSYVDASYPVGNYSNWNPAEAPYIENNLALWPDNLEGYIYMSAPSNNEFKFTMAKNWDNDYGDNGGDGTLDRPGANIVLPGGYYKINVDLIALTYTAVSTAWGVIGDATAGGWDSDQNLTYNPASQTWRGAVRLNAGSFKFRANDGWDINYGDNGANGSLEAGGSNISNSVVADYDITLDLSTPNNYKYSANRWGLIGDGTPGGWDTDTDMTWDATNGVFTVTLNLTAASCKFRANDGWDVNLGDNGADGSLEPGGSNISIPSAGNYTVTLNTITNTYTLTKN